MKEYQHFLVPKFTPFDPLELARETERIVTREGPEGLERKYTDFYSVPVYRGNRYRICCGLLFTLYLLLEQLVEGFSRQVW